MDLYLGDRECGRSRSVDAGNRTTQPKVVSTVSVLPRVVSPCPERATIPAGLSVLILSVFFVVAHCINTPGNWHLDFKSTGPDNFQPVRSGDKTPELGRVVSECHLPDRA